MLQQQTAPTKKNKKLPQWHSFKNRSLVLFHWWANS